MRHTAGRTPLIKPARAVDASTVDIAMPCHYDTTMQSLGGWALQHRGKRHTLGGADNDTVHTSTLPSRYRHTPGQHDPPRLLVQIRLHNNTSAMKLQRHTYGAGPRCSTSGGEKVMIASPRISRTALTDPSLWPT